MTKDSYWFKHDSNAGRDLKLQEITLIYSHWGKGIFWDVIEVLREQAGYKFEIKKLQMLCRMILCDDFIKFKNWYTDCVRLKLFVEKNGFFYSKTLIKRMENWEIKKSNGSKGGRPKKTETITETITETKPKRNRNDNRNKTIREEKRREYNKIYKDNFEKFRVKYPGTKRGLDTEFDNFITKHKDWDIIVNNLEFIINSQIRVKQQLAESGKFVPAWKNLQTWINNRCWEEEITTVNKKSNHLSMDDLNNIT